MLKPCDPCSCPGAPCEQCMFGYQSEESNHKTMKHLIEGTLAGEKPFAYQLAEEYIRKHPNWRAEMRDGVEEKMKERVEGVKVNSMLKTGVLLKCERCGKEKFFEDKNNRGDAKADVISSDWKDIGGLFVCPECYDIYKKLMDEFWYACKYHNVDGDSLL